MADLPSTPTDSSLNPAAPTFTMPQSGNPQDQSASTTPTTQTNGQPKTSNKQKRPDAKPTPNVESTGSVSAGAGTKLSGAELKKQKAAEKAARRAEKVAEKGALAQQEAQVPGAGHQQPGPVQARENQERERQRRMSTANRDGGGNGTGSEVGHHRRTASTTVRLPVRGGPQTSQPAHQPQQQGDGERNVSAATREKTLDKRVPMLGHLYTAASGRRANLATADRQIHPAVLTLGLQLRDYVICGSNARTVATLLVFKKVIQSYDTPSGVALSRDLTRHLSQQINFLSQARQLCIAQGNAIRWIKKLITALDPDLADTAAKSFLCGAIDTFIREKITLADEVIASQAVARMEDQGEVILTYGKSSVVEKTLLTAHESGKKFKVIVVDSRPLFEGKNLARSLVRAGLPSIQYCLLSGLADVVEQEGVTKCFLGASAMLGNGRLSSRAGSAMVAMMAKESSGAQGRGKVPVIVLCESVKFTAKVALDSLAMNEVADADVLVEREDVDTFIDPQFFQAKTDGSQQQQQQQQKKGGKGGNNNNNDDESADRDKKGLDGWRDQPNLFLVNLMYDVTPTEYLDMVISELGSLPPNAVPVVNGVHGGDE